MGKIIGCAGIWLSLATLASAALPMRVMVSIPPQKYFVEQIGGTRVAVDVMVPPGSDPHTFEPRPASRVALERAQIYFAIGDSFERAWLGRLVGGIHGPKIVQTDGGIAKLGPPSTADSDRDPHIWLAPPLVKIQAGHIRDGLIAIDPEGARTYTENYRRFAEQLDRLDGDLKRLFANVPSREFFVLHPAWGYFAATYGLTQKAIEVEGKNPTPRELQGLVEQLKAQKVKVIFAQPQRSLRLAEIVAAGAGARVEIADDLSPDWERNLRHVAAEVHAALQGATR